MPLCMVGHGAACTTRERVFLVCFHLCIEKNRYLSVKERWFHVAYKTDGCITCPSTVALQICKAGSLPLLLFEMKDVAIQPGFLEPE